MLLLNVRKTEQGFTLIETLIVFVIVGILSAIAAPSFLSMFNRNKVNEALEQVRGALQEAQREAIRKSQSCTVTINTTNKKITSPCLVTGTRDLCEKRDGSGNCTQSRVTLVSTTSLGTPPSITFSFRGNTNSGGTIVIHSSDSSTSQQGCLVISTGLGIIRTGDYSGSTASPSASNCTTKQ
ncbi:type IV pilin protein [Cyanosarcina cf. burmensis CCALA 770]|nr:type IV pilin protein [Cyanosarcina cf. burmensis CCALA 770]